MRSQTWYIRREGQWLSNCLHNEDAKSGVGAIRQGRKHLHKHAPFGTAHLFWNSVSGVSLNRTMFTIRAVQTASVVTPFSRRRRSFRPSATFSGPRGVCSPGIGAARDASMCVSDFRRSLAQSSLARLPAHRVCDGLQSANSFDVQSHMVLVDLRASNAHLPSAPCELSSSCPSTGTVTAMEDGTNSKIDRLPTPDAMQIHRCYEPAHASCHPCTCIYCPGIG